MENENTRREAGTRAEARAWNHLDSGDALRSRLSTEDTTGGGGAKGSGPTCTGHLRRGGQGVLSHWVGIKRRGSNSKVLWAVYLEGFPFLRWKRNPDEHI